MISSTIGRALSSCLIFGVIGGGSYGTFLALSNSDENSKVQINKNNQEIQKDSSIDSVVESKTIIKEKVNKKTPLSSRKDEINNLLLEVIWSKRNSITKLPEDHCFLLREEESNIQTLDMKEKIKSDTFKEENKKLCQTIRNTTLIEDKQLKDEWEEALWIGGYKGKVEEFINKNLSGFLSDSGFSNNSDLTSSNPHLTYFKELLNNSCSEMVNDRVPWAIEVTCIKKNPNLSERENRLKEAII